MENKFSDRTWILMAKKLAGNLSMEEATELEEQLTLDPELKECLERMECYWSRPVKDDAKNKDSS